MSPTSPRRRQVSLADDINKCDPKAMPMRKGASRMWHLSVSLKLDAHEDGGYADGVWQDDPASGQRTANALEALVWLVEPLDSQSVCRQKDLQAAARKDQLDLLAQERTRPVGPRVSFIGRIPERASTVTPRLDAMPGEEYEAYAHWGLNE